MTDAELPDLGESLHRAIGGTFSDRGEMVIRWALVADVYDATGERVQYVQCSPDAHRVDALGLLHFGIEVQREEQD